MTRQQALETLEAHGFEPDSPTAVWPHLRDADGQMIYDPSSTFDLEVGVKVTYTTSEIRNWLGY
jgi:hypothetical protein